MSAIIRETDPTDRFACANGVYPGIDNEDYHKGPGLSSTGMKELLRSPAHYLEYLRKQREEDRAKSVALLMGSAFHIAVLEPQRWPTAVVKALDRPRLKAADKEAHAEFAEAHKGAIILPGDTVDLVLRMRDAVHAHPLAGVLLDSGSAEDTAYYTDPSTGLLLKARSDWWSDAHECVVDLKSARDASLYEFSRAVVDMGYHLSAAHYRHVFHGAGRPFRKWFFLACEKEPPFGVAIYEAPDDVMNQSEIVCRRAYERLAECERTNRWPSYPEDIRVLDLPPWAYRIPIA